LLQDGGSLDLILKKAGRIPEPILGKLTSSVSTKNKKIRHYTPIQRKSRTKIKMYHHTGFKRS
jgi:hypothetical protein